MATPFQTPFGEQSTPDPSAPHLVRFLVKHAAIGVTMAVVFVAVILVFNIGNLTVLFVQSDIGPLAIALTTVMISLTFASLQMGFAVMFSSEDIDKHDAGRCDPLMTDEQMRQIGLRPLPVKQAAKSGPR